MADIVVSVASKVAEYLVAPVGRQCGNVIFTDSHVDQLEKELHKLEDARVRVQRSVDDAQKNNMREITREVNRWKKEAETAANKARGVLDNDVRAKKTCFFGCLPNPKERYRLGRDARKTVQDIESLILQGEFTSVSYESAPPGQVAHDPDVNSLASDGGDTITDSRASIFQGIMKALDDEKLKVIGVYGPGGVGKTTLLEEVEKKLRKGGRPFHMIVKATVSQNYVLKNIQEKIAYDLKLDLKDMQNEGGRANRLLERLRSDPDEKVLIILDDLWEKLDLKAVGIPSGDVSGKCKLLLTSRFRDVLEQKMRADRIFLLKGLNNVEAFRLFEKTVGDRLKDDEELKAIAAQVVKKLVGLPLLIISIATTLKYSSVFAWKNALKKINNEKMETIVKLSYDHLGSDDTRSLFLLCGLIGGTIQVELLLGLGMGLGFEGFNNTIEESRDTLNDMLNELHSVCLLQDGGDDKENVTIHDLYSEVVVSHAFSGQHSLMINSNYGSWPKEKLEKCWACLVNVGNDRLAELMLCRFPHVKILMLSEQYEMGDCSRMDFTHMQELRALCLCSMSITSLPSSMEILWNLQSLSINCNVEDVAILGKLKALQILSFAGSRISRLPKEIGELTNLQSLNLSNCYSLKIIEPGTLKGLINLEELHMKGICVQWMGKHEIPSESFGVGIAELKSLTKLASLEISIPHPIILLEDGDLPFGNLVRFWITIGDVYGREFEGLKTMGLNLEGCDNILSIEWVQKALQKTQYLYLCKLSEFKKSAHELCTQGFRELKHLDIDDSPSITYIASSSDGLPLTAFMKLESLFLRNLVNLEKIYHGPIAPECFSKLKAVSVGWCGRLKYLWRLSDMQRFVQLEQIGVWECDSMQSIITHDAGEEIVSADNRVALPKVRRLVLHQLPNMTSFCARAEITSENTPIQVSFPSLESLVMVGLLDLEKILYGQPPLEHSNLKSIEIRESRSKSSFFKSDWILKLPNLESLEIWSSPLAEAVFDLGELKVTRDVEILSRLMEMTIQELPNLRCMWKHDVKLQGISVFRSLKKLVVIKTGLAFLFPVSVAKCLRELSDIDVKDCLNMKAVIVDEEGRDEGVDDFIEFPLLKRLHICNCPMEKFFSYPHGNKDPVTATSDSQDAYSNSFFDQKVSFPRLESLVLQMVGSKSSFFKLDWILKLPNLESLAIRSSPLAEAVFDVGELKVTRDVEILSRLMEMTIQELPNLRCMWKQDVKLQGISVFRSLKKLVVIKTGLAFLFPMSVAKYLRELRDIDVKDCPNMKAVIMDEEGRDEGTNDVIEFPLLKRLHICNCPMEKFFSYPHGNKDPVTATSDSQDAYSNSFFDQKVSLPSLESLSLESVGSFKRIWHGDLPRRSFCELATLTLENCFELLNVFPSTIIGRLHNLKRVEIANCPSLESLFDCGSLDANTEQTTVLLPKLEDVWVTESGKMRSLVKRDSQMIWGFPSLKVVFVTNCSDLQYLFPNFTATRLEKLQRIDIRRCEQLKEVVPEEECGQSKADAMSCPSLRHLSILQCPNFGAFVRSPTSVKRQSGEMAEKNDEFPQPLFNEMVTFPNIRSLKIEGLQCKELWNNQIPTDSFSKLESLELKNCDNLRHIAPSHMWKRLQRCLGILRVISCRSIEIIYEGDGTDTENGKLRRLVLRDLENLRHIWQSDGLPNIPFPDLRYVDAVRCSRLKMLFATFTAEFLGQIKELVVESCEDMELIAGHEKWEEATGTAITFSKLTDLRLFELPKFRSFLPEKYSLKSPYSEDFPSLRDLSIISCGSEPDRGIVDWNNRPLSPYRQLIRRLYEGL